MTSAGRRWGRSVFFSSSRIHGTIGRGLSLLFPHSGRAARQPVSFATLIDPRRNTLRYCTLRVLGVQSAFDERLGELFQ
jgi:hypothetical protein